MKERTLQVEDGDFTRIINPVLEELIKIPFKGCELAVAMFIIRKTWGFKKTQDAISLTQFQSGTGRSRQTIVTALKNLELVNVAILVKRGNIRNDCNIWMINKYINTWKLVNMARLVKRNDKPSLMKRLNLVKTARHTKDTTKEILQKKNSNTSVANATVKIKPLEESKISSKMVSVLKEFSPTGELDGDYRTDNIFPAKVVAKQIVKFIGKDLDIENPTHHKEILDQFRGFMNRLDQFDRNKATKMSYIKYNFNSLTAKIIKKL